MNFGQALLTLFALAQFAAVDGRGLVRGGRRELFTSIKKGDYYVNSYEEELGDCIGAVCGLWGDPHVLSCDGRGYDCNARGLFTMMKNFLYNIQGHFIHVTSDEIKKMLGNGRFHTATYTSDIMIQNVQDPDVPVMQFSFPEFDLEVPSEKGCITDVIYSKWLDGYPKIEKDTIQECREYCQSLAAEGCTKFTYTARGWCFVAGDDGNAINTPSNWSNTVSGPVSKCGYPHHYSAREGTEIDMAKELGNGACNGKNDRHCQDFNKCPVMYYEDGVLQDISETDDGSYLYGDANTKSSAKLEGHNKIKIVYETDGGSLSEIMIETAGYGPGENFGCHWNIFICLPANEEDAFTTGGLGLLGSPDGNPDNDWMEPDGTVIDTSDLRKKDFQGQEAFDYCTSNWCVSQEDSLMVPPLGASYNDIKCIDEEYIDFELDEACEVSVDAIHNVCDDYAFDLKANCEMECCLGGCNSINQVIDNVVKLTHPNEDPNDFDFKTDEENPFCDDDTYGSTGETVCPTASGNVVKVIHQTAAIPDDEPIIYGIVFKDASDIDHGREVSFRVANPFENNADTYIRYEKKVGQYANDPDCDKLIDTAPGCDEGDGALVTAGCIEYPGVPGFALVDVYFASGNLVGEGDPDTEVEKCCKPLDYSGVGVIKYSFKIQCSCPDAEQA